MPRQRIGGSRRTPGSQRIGKATVQRGTTPPQPPSVTTEYVPNTPQVEAQPAARSAPADRTFKPVPGETVFMAEGGVIEGIQKGIGEPVVDVLTFLHKLMRKAELVYWLAGDNMGYSKVLSDAGDKVEQTLRSAKSELK